MEVLVYAHWRTLRDPLRLGTLYARRTKGQEIFEYRFHEDAIPVLQKNGIVLDPLLSLFSGPQFPPSKQASFGVFADASPDRWGRRLMDRRFEYQKRIGIIDPSARLYESDYLLGVHDIYRAGALRFKRVVDGEFVDNQHDFAAPSFARLRELEAACQAIDDDREITSDHGRWIRMLVAPGGSLGGTRPKASVVDEDGQLWIAKFPKSEDSFDIGAWEFVLNTLAAAAGMRVPECRTQRFASKKHTLLIRRFDRNPSGERLHFASAMTLTGHVDGDNHSTGVSYLEIAEVLARYGSQTVSDLEELWSRILFNVLVSNCDDHLRNHGFILEPKKGWRLSEAYDMNPVAEGAGLSLNISEHENALDLDLVRSIASHFRVKEKRREEIIKRYRSTLSHWPAVADATGISKLEQDRMSTAFGLL